MRLASQPCKQSSQAGTPAEEPGSQSICWAPRQVYQASEPAAMDRQPSIHHFAQPCVSIHLPMRPPGWAGPRAVQPSTAGQARSGEGLHAVHPSRLDTFGLCIAQLVHACPSEAPYLSVLTPVIIRCAPTVATDPRTYPFSSFGALREPRSRRDTYRPAYTHVTRANRGGGLRLRKVAPRWENPPSAHLGGSRLGAPFGYADAAGMPVATSCGSNVRPRC